ncbi:MAG: shikimate kinase [Microbacteriaceae bacterium]|jgi:shikimate kinase|nr:shikimate kinase [Microbacteriaceae bacterium]
MTGPEATAGSFAAGDADVAVPAVVPVVVLIGAPGAGKTRLGKRIAKLLDVPFIDTDKRIVAQHGPIPAIFSEHGEARFRELEREQVIRALGERAVVALGGGAVLDPSTQADLVEHRVAQLSVSAEAVERRITGDKRPLVNGVAAWSALVEKRKPIYDRLARRTFDTSRMPLDTIAADLVTWIREDTHD